jgi:hypothetical protein
VSLDDPRSIERSRLEYTELEVLGSLVADDASQRQQLQGHGTIRLDDRGAIASIRQDEDFVLTTGNDAVVFASQSRLALDAKGVSRFDPAEVDVASLDQKVDDGRVAPDPRQGDMQFAGETSEQQITAGLSAYGAGAHLPHGYMTRTGAFLRLHPEKERELTALFTNAATPPRARELLTDIWSVAGDAAAQQAMRDALAWGADHVDPKDQAHYVQRFIFVEAPEAASASFVAASYESARDQGRAGVRGASAVALGAMVNRMAASPSQDDRVVARQMHALLTRDLMRAKSAVEQGALLEALGNAAQPEDARLVAAYGADSTDDVRESTALALRHMQSEAARSALLTLAGDRTPRVARAALRALRSQDLTRDEWAELESMAVAGTTNTAADSTLVELVRVRADDAGPHAAPILRSVLARTTDTDLDLRETIQALLG